MEEETLPPATPLAAALPGNANVIDNKTGAGILMRTLKRGDGLHFPTPGDSCLVCSVLDVLEIRCILL